MRYIKNQLDEILYCIRSDDIVTDQYDCDIVGYLKKDRIVDSTNGDVLFMVHSNGDVAEKDSNEVIGHIHGVIEESPRSSSASAVSTTNFSGNSVVRVILWLLFFYFTAPLSISLIGLILLSFLSNMGAPSAIAVIFFVIMFISYIRYCVQLYREKCRLRLKWGAAFRFYLKWVLKGPFAFKNLNVLKRI